MQSSKINARLLSKRIVSVLLAAVIAVSVVPTHVEAISDDKMFDKYHQWMADNCGGSWEVILTDIDRNGVKDAVVVEYMFRRVLVLTYVKSTKKVKELVYLEFPGDNIYIGLKNQGFYLKTKARGKSNTTFYKMKNGKVKKIRTAEFGKTKSGKKYYKINGKKVKRAVYKSYFKGYYQRTYTSYYYL